MSKFRNDLGEDRVCPTLGYLGYDLVKAGETFDVPNDEWPHWVAGGFTPLDPDPAAPAVKTTAKQAAPAAAEGTEG